ncbi:MAG: hypothetical protein E6R13_01480 [Spirochaetes bacterium]|nr:MAG: hypothetical protein E6R13_01480 [Spirochaetota bacterium]
MHKSFRQLVEESLLEASDVVKKNGLIIHSDGSLSPHGRLDVSPHLFRDINNSNMDRDTKISHANDIIAMHGSDASSILSKHTDLHHLNRLVSPSVNVHPTDIAYNLTQHIKSNMSPKDAYVARSMFNDLLSHPKADESTFGALTNHAHKLGYSHDDVDAARVRHPNTSANSIHHKVTNTSNEEVHLSAIMNPNTASHTLRHIATSHPVNMEHGKIHQELLRHKNTDSETLHHIASNGIHDEYTKSMILRHPNVSNQTKQLLDSK